MTPTPATGILGRPDALPFVVRREPPPADLAWCVDRFWTSAWALPPGRSATARILPHPCVNLTLEKGRLMVTGVAPGVWTRRLSGTEEAFGVKFRAGAFRALLDGPVSAVPRSSASAHGLLPGSERLEHDLAAVDTLGERAAVFSAYSQRRGLRTDDTVELVAAVVEALVHDPSVRRVRDAGERFGVGERTLQRLFAEYVGVSPRWVLRRGRLHAAADRVIALAVSERPGGWAEVAAELGYVDQAHFSRDFSAVLGVPPGRWAAELLSVD